MEFNLTWFEVKLYLGVLDHLESVKLVSALHVDLLLLDHPSEVSLEQVFLCHIFLLHKALFLLLEDIKGWQVISLNLINGQGRLPCAWIRGVYRQELHPLRLTKARMLGYINIFLELKHSKSFKLVGIQALVVFIWQENFLQRVRLTQFGKQIDFLLTALLRRHKLKVIVGPSPLSFDSTFLYFFVKLLSDITYTRHLVVDLLGSFLGLEEVFIFDNLEKYNMAFPVQTVVEKEYDVLWDNIL
jgi:hypothetical protein